MRHLIRLIALLLPGLAACAAGGSPRPQLIEWGWDQPDTRMLRDHIAEMESAPFDGIVLTAMGLDGTKPINFQWQTWSKTAYTKAQFAGAAADLKATHFRKFRSNFLRFNTSPGDVGWFDDAGWQAITSNGRLAAWLCRAGGLKGLMFDVEQYTASPFRYDPASGHTFVETQRQAAARGRQLARAFEAERPRLTILFTFAHSLVSASGDLGTDAYGLLPAFVDGLLAGAPSADFHDALELAYSARNEADLEGLYARSRQARRVSLAPETYDRRMHTGFGIWMDNRHPTLGWNPDAPQKNYFSPEGLEHVLKAALKRTDRYVWLYSEKLNWWTGQGLNPAYRAAVAAARSESAGKGEGQ